MNIALIAAGSLIGKKEATWLTIFNLAQAYQKKGYYVSIIAKSHSQLPKIEEIAGITIYRLFGGKSKFKQVQGLISTMKTLKYIKKNKGISFDILHGFSSAPFLALELKIAKLEARKAKIIHSIKSYSKTAVGRKFFFLLNLVDKITMQTEVTATTLLPQKLLKKTKIVRSNIDLKKFKPRNRKELKEKYGLSDKKVILYYGALREQKGADYLIKAMPEIIKKHPEARFIFLVRSHESKQIFARYRSMIEELGCEKYVELGYPDVIIEEYVNLAEAVILAYPNLIGTEGNPSCLLEGMASKTAVITTFLPELQEIVNHEHDVLMAKPGDHYSLAAEINRILSDEELRLRLVENAFVKAQEFGTEKIAEEFLKIYRE